MRIYDDVTQLIGNTPLVRLNRLNQSGATVAAYSCTFNPAASSMWTAVSRV